MTGSPGTPHGRPRTGSDGGSAPGPVGDGLDDAGLDDAIAALGRRARERNRGRARRLTELLATAETRDDPVVREEAVRLCHTMAGSAATFGEVGLSEAAGRLEAALSTGVDADVPVALDVLRAAAGVS
ncbi:Hpt domain-containing protein [Isoptericola nanjingensis]|uniref:Hpt domain-containing protein n=1 Tax=Isoptericola TaxID=254250 RepID=UPI0035E62110|nr:Hpt domain-containing protein [Isoptericola sp. QY 916]